MFAASSELASVMEFGFNRSSSPSAPTVHSDNDVNYGHQQQDPPLSVGQERIHFGRPAFPICAPDVWNIMQSTSVKTYRILTYNLQAAFWRSSKRHLNITFSSRSFWPPCVLGQAIIIFCPVVPSFSFFFFPSPNLSGRRLDVYHTSTHGGALVRI